MKTDSQNMKILEKNGLEMKSSAYCFGLLNLHENLQRQSFCFLSSQKYQNFMFRTVVFVSRSLNAF